MPDSTTRQTDSEWISPLIEAMEQFKLMRNMVDSTGLDDFSPFPQMDMLEEAANNIVMDLDRHHLTTANSATLAHLLGMSKGAQLTESEKKTLVEGLKRVKNDAQLIQEELTDLIKTGVFHHDLNSDILPLLSTLNNDQRKRLELMEDLVNGDDFDENAQIESITTQEIINDKTREALSDITTDNGENVSGKQKKATKVTEHPFQCDCHLSHTGNSKSASASKSPKQKSKRSKVITINHHNHAPKAAPLFPDDCLFCEFYSVFGKMPVNFIKAYEARLEQEGISLSDENHKHDDNLDESKKKHKHQGPTPKPRRKAMHKKKR